MNASYVGDMVFGAVSRFAILTAREKGLQGAAVWLV